jgi:hypothetical protein
MSGGGQGPVHLVGPHVVHFSSVREAVEQQSGLFEFLKQMLTIGLGGIAGLAAIFTEEGKIPGDIASRVMLGIFAVSSMAVVIASTFGISSYANFLREIGWLAEGRDKQLASLARRDNNAKTLHEQLSRINPTDTAELQKIEPHISDVLTQHVKEMEDSEYSSKRCIVLCAQAVYLAAGSAAIALILFAVIKLVDHHHGDVGPAEAMRAAEAAIRNTVDHPATIALDRFERTAGDDMRMTYMTGGGTNTYTVEMRSDGKITLIQSTKRP